MTRERFFLRSDTPPSDTSRGRCDRLSSHSPAGFISTLPHFHLLSPSVVCESLVSFSIPSISFIAASLSLVSDVAFSPLATLFTLYHFSQPQFQLSYNFLFLSSLVSYIVFFLCSPFLLSFFHFRLTALILFFFSTLSLLPPS